MKKKKVFNGNNILLLITVLLFIGMYAIGCVVYSGKGFTHLQTFLNILITNAALIVVASGMTCVMLTGGIDISVGSLIAMDCMFLAVAMSKWHWGAIPSILVVLLIGVVFGSVQGYLVGYLGIQPFIVSMAGMFFGRGMTAVISTDQLSITQDANKLFYSWANAKIPLPSVLGYTNKKGKLIAPFLRPTVIVALIVLFIIAFMLKKSRFGRSLYAVGGNETASKMMGLNVKRTKMMAYVLSSFLCSVAGILYCLNTMAGSVQQALGFEMDAIASAVIGGTLLTGGVGNVFGSFVGVLINGTIVTIVNSNGKLLSSWANIATAALLCFFIILQSIFAAIKDRSK